MQYRRQYAVPQKHYNTAKNKYTGCRNKYYVRYNPGPFFFHDVYFFPKLRRQAAGKEAQFGNLPEKEGERTVIKMNVI